MHGPGTGIGPALRKARLHRGKTLEEASRDTRIRAEYLQALEREAFHSLRGDVYVRGFLRSYSSYLGLNPDKVVSVYARASERPVEPPAVQPRLTAAKLLHRRGNWKLAVAVAVGALVVFGAVGLLSRSGSFPAPGGVRGTPPGAASASVASVTASIAVVEPVHVRIVADGVQVFAGDLRRGTTRTFEARNVLRVAFDPGNAVELTVNGKEIGAPGTRGVRFAATYNSTDYRETPSPSEV